jgi:hypothetical protein
VPAAHFPGGWTISAQSIPLVVLFFLSDLLISWLSTQVRIATWHLLREEDAT